jgi:hypothetical protein
MYISSAFTRGMAAQAAGQLASTDDQNGGCSERAVSDIWSSVVKTTQKKPKDPRPQSSRDDVALDQKCHGTT